MAESYSRWRLPQLWEMVAADDAADAHLHLATLRRQQTALETQRDRLRALRDQLAEAWPPEKSDAATMFRQRLNDMIEAVAATARGAAEVRVGVQIVTNAINEAREQLAPLVERYAKAESLFDPRVGRQAQKSLDEEARRILMSADVAVHDAAAALKVVLPGYGRISTLADIPLANGDTNSTGGGGSGGGGTTSSSMRLNGPLPPQFDPPAPVAVDIMDDDVALAESRSVIPAAGWQLGGVGTTQAGGVASSGPHEAIAVFGRVIGAGPASGMPVPSTDGGIRGPNAGAMRSIPGSVIGGAPAASARGGALRSPLASRQSAPAVVRPSSGGGYQDRSFEEYVARRRERCGGQEDQWTVNQGVAPLLEALPPVCNHDPGPGVIGLDR